MKVTRAKDFADPLEISFPSLPPGVEAPTSFVIPADKTEIAVTLVGHPAAEVGEWRLLVEARVARPARGARDPSAAPMGMGMGRRQRRSADGLIPVASEVTVVKVAETPVKGRFAPAAVEQGKTVKVVCQIDSAIPLTGSFTAKLDGLPPRATAQPVILNSDAKQVEFAVAIDPTTPPGEHRSLVCELAGIVGGQKVVYRVGRGGALKVEAVGGVKTDASGKALSPLEALRLEKKKDEPKKP